MIFNIIGFAIGSGILGFLHAGIKVVSSAGVDLFVFPKQESKSYGFVMYFFNAPRSTTIRLQSIWASQGLRG